MSTYFFKKFRVGLVSECVPKPDKFDIKSSSSCLQMLIKIWPYTNFKKPKMSNTSLCKNGKIGIACNYSFYTFRHQHNCLSR